MNRKPLTIVLAGMIAADPYQGGATWAVLQYALGFRQLGHEVYFIEPVEADKLQPAGTTLFESINAAYFRQVVTEFGLDICSSLQLRGTKDTVGMPYRPLAEICERADVLVNISGMLTEQALCSSIPIRVYLDLDPAFNQLWHASAGIDMRFSGHTHFVSIGLALGRGDCAVPTCGFQWITTTQPVVLSKWPVAHSLERPELTTVANWRGYGSIEAGSVFYGQKAHSVRQFVGLPALTEQPFVLALAIDPAEERDVFALQSHGWALVDPKVVAGTPSSYRRFIQESRGELGFAKLGYVVSKCGWFSDRSACYLASGRPVIAQETGFSQYLPTGEGLLSFSTIEEVVAGIVELDADYERHAKAARAIAEKYFDSDRVLDTFLQSVGAWS